MKSYLFCALATLAAVPCFANSNEGAPQYSDAAIYQSLPVSSEVMVGKDLAGNPIFQRSSGELTCTARTQMTSRHSSEIAYNCMRTEAPSYPVPPTPEAP